jgi:hypothetical protein
LKTERETFTANTQRNSTCRQLEKIEKSGVTEVEGAEHWLIVTGKVFLILKIIVQELIFNLLRCHSWMRWIQENAHVVLQNFAEIIDNLVTFTKKVCMLCSAWLRAKLFSQSSHNCNECVMTSTENPLAEFHPCVDRVARACNLFVKTAIEKNQ